MRALLLFNPNATTTDGHVRDVIAAALSSELELDVQPTKQRGHATHIAAGAVHEGVHAVFSLGGDGTANEVLQALAGTRVLMGVIPGGGANVFARALGLPNDPVAATAIMLDKLRRGESRTVNLGRAGARYFGFNAGFGFDAAVVRRVEQHPTLKRQLRQGAFVYLALREWLSNGDRHDPPISIEAVDGQLGTAVALLGGYCICVVGNTDPYTYLGSRPLHATPQARFDLGLDVLAIRKVTTPALLRIVLSVFGSGRHVRRPEVDYLHDLAGFTLRSPRPQPLMVDGDYAGEHEEVVFRSVPAALHVLA